MRLHSVLKSEAVDTLLGCNFTDHTRQDAGYSEWSHSLCCKDAAYIPRLVLRPCNCRILLADEAISTKHGLFQHELQTAVRTSVQGLEVLEDAIMLVSCPGSAFVKSSSWT